MSIAYFQPRVIHSTNGGLQDCFAIYDVYFRQDGNVETMTVDALSPKFHSFDGLRDWLKSQLESGIEKVVCGDLSYEYESARLRYWLECTELPVIKVDCHALF